LTVHYYADDFDLAFGPIQIRPVYTFHARPHNGTAAFRWPTLSSSSSVEANTSLLAQILSLPSVHPAYWI